MFDEFLLEVFFIKIKIRGCLKNITENTCQNIETYGIKNKNKISYIYDKIKYSLIIGKEEIILKRENDEFIHGMIFKENQELITNYYIKELNTSMEFKILTKKINITNNQIEIYYQNKETEDEYIYLIEMSDK